MENFLIFKNPYKKEGSNQPDFNVLLEGEGEDKKFTKWGVCWSKTGQKGKFLSCKKEREKVGNKQQEKKVEVSSKSDKEVEKVGEDLL